MVKKFSTLALAALLALPGGAAAASVDDMQAQIDALSRQLEALKAQMSEMAQKKAPAAPADGALAERVAELEEKSEDWDQASRFQISGDFRTRLDYVSADTPAHYEALNVARGVHTFTSVQPALATIAGGFPTVGDMLAGLGPIMGDLTTWRTNIEGMGITDQAQQDALFFMFTNSEVQSILMSMAAFPATTVTDQMTDARALVGFMQNLSPAARTAIFNNMGYLPTAAQKYDNDTIWTNRLRLNLQAKATENVEFKGRLAMYKAWGMQNNPVDYSYNNGMGGGPFALSGYMADFDGATTRNPNDSILRVDRAFVNWNNIGDLPMWFSIGRRPVTDGPPNHLKLNNDSRMATPSAVMDWPFDGLTLGYAYNSLFGLGDVPGRIRFCYGRGFESGPDSDFNRTLNDVDFAGISWDVYSKGDRLFYLQSYGAFNVFNVPDGVTFGNPLEFAAWENDPGFYNPFDSSRDLVLNRANLGNIYHSTALYMDKYQKLNYFLHGSWSRTDAKGMDELGTSLLGEWWGDPVNKDGYMVHAGVRYDLGSHGLKFGAEFNHGTKNWIAMAPGHDDLYQSKLAARGNVYEIYTIWDIPAGEAISKYGKAFMRLGYQHYDYRYTGSGFWLGEPKKISDLANDPLNAQFYTPIDKMDQVYLTFEAYF
jgi:hypothetical protein